LANAQNCATSGPEEISAAQILIKAAMTKTIPKIIMGTCCLTQTAQVLRILCGGNDDCTLLVVPESFSFMSNRLGRVIHSLSSATHTVSSMLPKELKNQSPASPILPAPAISPQKAVSVLAASDVISPRV
jgi:hypothetical protein